VANLFGAYELLAKSGLFDAEYYLRSNPDIAALNVDPLMHYLERGAIELRNPSEAFDAQHYAQLCQERGEHVENPLLHYIQVGSAKGLTSHVGGTPILRASADKPTASNPITSKVSDLLIGLDRIAIDSSGGATRLKGVGWCLATSPVIDLKVGLGAIAARARYGLPRPDVAQTFPQYLKADHSGFEFNLDRIPADQEGIAELVFTARTSRGDSSHTSIPIDLDALRAAPGPNDTADDTAVDQSTHIRPTMQLYIDSAEIDEAGILHIIGWAVCIVPIVSVQVFVDNEKLAAAEYGKPREDIALSRAEYPNARYSGFVLHTDVSSYGDGERVIKVQALASTGISRETILPFMLSGARRASVPFGERINVHLFCELIEVTTGGRVALKGWVVGSAITEQLSVLLDGNEIGDAEIGLERPDVGNHFPALTHARLAGFSFRHRVAAISDGEHLIILRHRAGGEETDLLLPVLAAHGDGIDDEAAVSCDAESDDLRLSIDLPKLIDGTVPNPIRSTLEIAGWALARRGVVSIDIKLDGECIKSTRTGIRRLDVQRAFPNRDGAISAGFSALLPHRTLPKGAHTVSIVLRDQAGQVASSEFRIVVEEAPETEGPWSLRHRMTPAEIDLLSRPLVGDGPKPSFDIVLPMKGGAKSLEHARETLASLARQEYVKWRLHILVRTRQSASNRRSLLNGCGEILGRTQFLHGGRALGRLLAKRSAVSYLMILRPGDVLGCDALLEYAAHVALHPAADFLYSDERRLNPSSGKAEAFFKPQWSPDLLLSMNYLGRAWCARANLFRRSAVRPSQLFDISTYDLALRLTEQATSIEHVPATLFQATGAYSEDYATERKALQRTLARRQIAATVKIGRATGTFRVRRRNASCGLVSIIIPTCAARGLIRTCIETLRSLTNYRNFEIVCIENIPPDKQDWKDWLRAHADCVIETAEAFNWSRFNNLAVESSRGEYLVFLNDDVEIIDPAWLNVLLEEAQRPEVGIVGPQLLYPDRRVQHAGMFLAKMGVARHAFRYAAEDDPGYFGLALTQRNVIAVTGACLMTRREAFAAVGRFDESHDVVNNDIDYCLRIRRHGLRTIYTPHTTLIHHELASRAEIIDSYDSVAFESKWRSVFVTGDPFFHPRLAKDRDDYSVEWEPVETVCAGHPILRRESIRKILIVKLDHIGDCVVALPAIRRLQHHFPTAKLSVLTGRASRAVWALEPAIDEVIEFDFFHARSASGLVERTEDDWRALHKRLAPLCFDLAVDLRKNWETRPVLQQTGARYVAGFDMKGKFPWLDVSLEWSEDVALIRKRQHTADDLINLVDAIAAASEPDRAVIARLPPLILDEALAGLPRARLLFRKPVVCVHPSAGNEMKQWPPEYFSTLIDELIETNNVNVILIGAPDENELGTRIIDSIANTKSVWSLIGHIALGQLPSLITRCSLFVGNDSGPKHIAAGLGVPTVGIHSGVVDSREWGPKGNNAVAIQRAMACAPCYHLRIDDCPRGLTCLRDLLPTDVARVCQRMLASVERRTEGRHSRRRATELIHHFA
jgi:O-antigen biosynthesis protein